MNYKGLYLKRRTSRYRRAKGHVCPEQTREITRREFRRTILGDIRGILRLTRGIETTTTTISNASNYRYTMWMKVTRFLSAYRGGMQALLRTCGCRLIAENVASRQRDSIRVSRENSCRIT